MTVAMKIFLGEKFCPNTALFVALSTSTFLPSPKRSPSSLPFLLGLLLCNMMISLQYKYFSIILCSSVMCFDAKDERGHDRLEFGMWNLLLTKLPFRSQSKRYSSRLRTYLAIVVPGVSVHQRQERGMIKAIRSCERIGTAAYTKLS